MDWTNQHTEMTLRWIHFVAGITWIGHLYFFNFVNGPFAKTLDAETRKKVVPELMPRALWWFRWGAMFTFLSGLAYFLLIAHRKAGMFLSSDPTTYDHWSRWILVGALLGTVMWFNVWFIIWPAQKKLIGWLKAGVQDPSAPALTKKALMASRFNTFASVPMLFCMGAASHFGFSLIRLLAALVIGPIVAWILIKLGPAVGKLEAAPASPPSPPPAAPPPGTPPK